MGGIMLRRTRIIIQGQKSRGPNPHTMYYDYSEEVRKIPAHRILAINGPSEDFIKVDISTEVELVIKKIEELISAK